MAAGIAEALFQFAVGKAGINLHTGADVCKNLRPSVTASACFCTRWKNFSVLGNFPGRKNSPMAGVKLKMENFFSEYAAAISLLVLA